MKEVFDFFGANEGKKLTRTEWLELSPEDKVQLKAGVADGSLNY